MTSSPACRVCVAISLLKVLNEPTFKIPIEFARLNEPGLSYDSSIRKEPSVLPVSSP